MPETVRKYSLDTGFFIEGWRKYYSPDFCDGYWEIIDSLAQNGIVFITSEVFKELLKIDDEISQWIKVRKYFVKEIDDRVQECLRIIYEKNPLHNNLVNDIKNRSIADPWVIAHAMAENATVVTKEAFYTGSSVHKIKIPNVCKNMDVLCIDDFKFIREINITFTSRHLSVGSEQSAVNSRQ